MKLVIYPAIDEQRLATLRAVSNHVSIVNCQQLDQASTEIEAADAFYGKITPALLAAAQQLRWVQSPTASLEHYLFPELIEHPCLLSNMRGLFSDVVADHALAMILCFARNFQVYLRQSHWSPVGDTRMVADFVSAPGVVSEVDRTHQHLSDLTLGVVGTGFIGQEILRRAQAFGMSLRGVDPVVRRIPKLELMVEPLQELPRILPECDYVVIAAPQTPETTKLFSRSLIQRMKPSAVLINVGRGAIVDLHDLTESLQAHEIAGAGLDVVEIEPLPADHPLWTMTNVIITPHVAAASPRIAGRHLETLLENLRRFVNGEPPATLVDKQKWY